MSLVTDNCSLYRGFNLASLVRAIGHNLSLVVAHRLAIITKMTTELCSCQDTTLSVCATGIKSTSPYRISCMDFSPKESCGVHVIIHARPDVGVHCDTIRRSEGRR
ncbi:MAG TPA: hypothetical protein V6D50_08315 [Chroococcales cyanobacterium]